MGEQVPSKQLDLPELMRWLRHRHVMLIEQGAADTYEGHIHAYIESLQRTLRGIQSCSTCERCRGAATLALGHTCDPYDSATTCDQCERDAEQPTRGPCSHPWDKVGISGEGKPFCAECCVNLVKDPPWSSPEPSAEQVLERGRQVEEQGLRLRYRVDEHAVPRTGYVLVWHEHKGELFPTAWHARSYHHPEMGANLYPPAIYWERISAPGPAQPPKSGRGADQTSRDDAAPMARGSLPNSLAAVPGCIHDSTPTTLCEVCYPSQPPGDVR